ncbi:MAG TPA: hypothetical protein VIY73_27990, partial [Polyangiaceae bacterium]
MHVRTKLLAPLVRLGFLAGGLAGALACGGPSSAANATSSDAGDGSVATGAVGSDAGTETSAPA